MLVSKRVMIKWCPSNKDHYINKGYKFTKQFDEFEVDIKDLSLGSSAVVDVECDYCHNVFQKRYACYVLDHEEGRDCCKSCGHIKSKEGTRKKYGVDNVFQAEVCKAKSKQTCLEKYGVEIASKSAKVKDKIANTNIDKYGCKCTLQNTEVKAKAEETCKEHYGVTNPFSSADIKLKIKATNEAKYGEGNIAHTPEIAERIKATNMERYGVPYTTQAEEVVSKMRSSLYKNGTVPSSNIEKAVCKMLHNIYGDSNCQDGFPLDRINMDCLLSYEGCLIDVEYDGWYWHKNKQEYDKRRNYFLTNRGYKVLRIRSTNMLPTEKQIKEAIDYLVKGNHSLAYIDLDI